jgi:hypothetical protein
MIEFFSTYWPEMMAVCVILSIPVSVAISMWRDHRRMMKIEAHPERMSGGQYKDFNKKRFHK